MRICAGLRTPVLFPVDFVRDCAVPAVETGIFPNGSKFSSRRCHLANVIRAPNIRSRETDSHTHQHKISEPIFVHTYGWTDGLTDRLTGTQTNSQTKTTTQGKETVSLFAIRQAQRRTYHATWLPGSLFLTLRIHDYPLCRSFVLLTFRFIIGHMIIASNCPQNAKPSDE